MEEIKKFLKESLPAISTEELNLIMDMLSTLGVECFEDMEHIEPEKDLTKVLKLVQARKLKKKIEATFNQDKMQHTPQFQPQFEIVQPSSASASVDEIPIVELIVKPNVDQDSLLEKIPFDKFPKMLLSKLEKGERPSPGERREAVRIIVAGIMEHMPAPRKKHLEAVALEVVRRYPASFKDSLGNEPIGLGHGSLLCQLIARAENCRRVSGTIKRKVSSTHEKMPKRVADRYGCINHQPSDFPEGENDSTQIDKKLFLKSEFVKSIRDEGKIDKYMCDTYTSQRITINSKATIREVKCEWPFLTERKYLMLHADNLIGFSLREKFECAIKEKLTDLTNYVKSIPNTKLDLNPPHLNIIKILCELFKEDSELLMKIYEDDKSLVDICEEAPVTPFIACIGNPFELAPVCTVFVEREQLEETIPLDDALLMWFSTFYIFN